jgi:S1-C subfamily serine protease
MGRLVAFLLSAILASAVTTSAFAKGPFGSIRVGEWKGGAYTDDKTGAFSHCAAGVSYRNGNYVVVSKLLNGSWSLGFANPGFHFTTGEKLAIGLSFDGLAPTQFAGIAIDTQLAGIIVPDYVLAAFRKSRLMKAEIAGAEYGFALTTTDRVAASVENCFAKVKSTGIANAGDFSASPVKSVVQTTPTPNSPPGQTTQQDGTGFLISTNGHIITNNHVIDGCVGDIHGNLSGQGTMTLRTVATDETNDLALLQAPEAIKGAASIRATPIHPGDSIIVIGYPLHGLLTSDFTVSSGIVSSLSGLLNDTRYLQISAGVQEGNSGGPLLDTSGNLVGVVAAKINALKFAKATGDLPQNINFAIKTGAVRDFIDNSAVPYQTTESKQEFKTAEIASKARTYTLLISCTAKLKD